MKCIILAGGFATRLWPLTENKAKPLLHLKDKPLISHIVESLPEEIDIIISTNAIFEASFNEWIKQYEGRRITIFVEDSGSDEFKKGALGATALVIQEKNIEEDLMLIAGDNYFGFKIEDMIGSFKGNPLLAAYDIQDLEKAKKFGVVIEKDGEAIEFQEKPDHPKSTLVSTGCYLFPQKNLKDIIHYAIDKNDDLGGIFEYLAEKGDTINVFRFSEDWVDIGSYDAYLKANQDLLEGNVVERDDVNKVGKNEFEGSVYLGEGAHIEDSVIDGSVILSSNRIKNCVIRHCVIDSDCELEGVDLSYKMIRQGSVIKKG